MGRRWNPGAEIGLNEQIGRRLFESIPLKGVTGQPPFSGLQLYHFEEKRGNETSVDRLGASGVQKSVVNYLKPRACTAGKNFHPPKTFLGWSFVQARELVEARTSPNLIVTASPEKSDEEEKCNIYHAHITNPLVETSSTMKALYLRHIFEEYGDVNMINAPASLPQARLRISSGIAWLIERIQALASKLLV